jgi:hypothetical protein
MLPLLCPYIIYLEFQIDKKMPVQEVLTVDGLHDIEKAEPNRQYRRGSILYDHHAHYDDSQVTHNFLFIYNIYMLF